MRTYKIEVEYEYHPNGPAVGEHPRLHRMYVAAKGKTLEEAMAFAKKSYETRVRELGWTRITTLREIRPPKRANDPPIQKSVSSESLPSGRKSAGGSNTKRKSGTSTGRRRTTSTSKRAASPKRKKSA